MDQSHANWKYNFDKRWRSFRDFQVRKEKRIREIDFLIPPSTIFQTLETHTNVLFRASLMDYWPTLKSLLFYSNGLFPATLHRVVIPEEELLQKKARQSIVFFLHPESSTMVKPLIEKTPRSKLQTYQAITALDHVNKRFAATYQYWSEQKCCL